MCIFYYLKQYIRVEKIKGNVKEDEVTILNNCIEFKIICKTEIKCQPSNLSNEQYKTE